MKQHYDAIIIGGSYAGLAAAMSLGRAIRNVLVIDDGKPCNRQTPFSHNFLTRDGETPSAIALAAREQLKYYDSVSFMNERVVQVEKAHDGFDVITDDGKAVLGDALLFATGIRDILPDINGVEACWGISVLHCPYCHGYEFRKQETAILANGEDAFHLAKLLSQWTDRLTIFSNGPSLLDQEQRALIRSLNIAIVELGIAGLQHVNGHVNALLMDNGESHVVHAAYTRPKFQQSSELPFALGCEALASGHIKVSGFGETSVPGIYAAGDNCSPMRSVANAVASGTAAGAFINMFLIDRKLALL